MSKVDLWKFHRISHYSKCLKMIYLSKFIILSCRLYHFTETKEMFIISKRSSLPEMCYKIGYCSYLKSWENDEEISVLSRFIILSCKLDHFRATKEMFIISKRCSLPEIFNMIGYCSYLKSWENAEEISFLSKFIILWPFQSNERNVYHTKMI